MDNPQLVAGPVGQTLDRAEIAGLAGAGPRLLVECDLEATDLSGLDLSGWRFERCNLRHALGCLFNRG